MKTKYIGVYDRIKLNHKKFNYLFKDEYLLRLYDLDLKKNKNIHFIENLDQVFNKDKKINFLKKKKKKYLEEISTSLNRIHGANHLTHEWGVLLDYYILISLIIIKRRYDTFLRIQDKKTIINCSQIDFFFPDSDTYKKKLFSQKELLKFIDFLIAKEKNFKNIDYDIQKNFIKKSYPKKKIFQKIVSFFYNFVVFLRKPILIVDGYLGFKNSIKIMLKSKFKILVSNYDYIENLKDKNLSYKKDYKLRNEIKFNFKKDSFDNIFLQYIKNTIPGSFVENYSSFFKSNIFISKNISKIGSAILLPSMDNYKYLAFKIKKQKKKIFTFQHGGLFDMRLFSPEDYLNEKYSDFNFLWGNKNGVGTAYFFKTNLKNFDNENKILFFPTVTLFQEETENLKLCNHLKLNQYFKLIPLLNDKLLNLHVKFTNYQTSEIAKKLWKKRFGKKIKIVNNSYKGDIFNKFSLTIIDNFSTPFFELIYHKQPFVILNNSKLKEFKPEFKKIIYNLKKNKILFNNEIELANFINENSPNFNNYWTDVINSKYFISIRKKIFPNEKFLDSKLIKILK